jgi:exopolysaccharide biosynthesis WecB/TagA/CpsF family protein
MTEISPSFAERAYLPSAQAPTAPGRIEAERSMPRPATVMLGGLPITVVDRAEAADRMIATALAHRGSGALPEYQTSANGQVLVDCAREPAIRDLFLTADAIHADGMPMVIASWQMSTVPLPERVATTDLVHDVMQRAGPAGVTSYLLGATAEVNAAAVANLRALYPDVPWIDGRNGYFTEAEEEAICADICARAPDILWIGLGAPKEQLFVEQIGRAHV